MKTKKPNNNKDLYQCIRCGYETKDKNNMRKHFNALKKICPATKNNIELNDEIKEEILANRVYHYEKIMLMQEKERLKEEHINRITEEKEKLKFEKEQLKYEREKLKEEKKKFQDQIKTMNNEVYHYVYLIQPKESVYNNVDIYKPGMTVSKEKTFDLKRLKSYGIGSELIMVCQCENANKMEKEILKEFNEKFERPYGNEYFKGNKRMMKQIIYALLMKEEIDDDII